jgi:putative membrane protein
MTLRLICLALVLAVLAWSGVAPSDRFTWWLEVSPVLLGLPLVITTHARFPLTSLATVLLTAHAVVLCVGGHWTYSEVPLGFWMQRVFDFSRNHYDRIGHFAQGFVPAIVAREILIRRSPLEGSRWLPVLALSVVLALSACYELFEWWTALAIGAAATAFLGAQGDPWDTQWDMFFALIGGFAALATLSRAHDRQLASVPPRT